MPSPQPCRTSPLRISSAWHLKHDRIAQTWIERIGSSPDGVVRVIAD